MGMDWHGRVSTDLRALHELDSLQAAGSGSPQGAPTSESGLGERQSQRQPLSVADPGARWQQLRTHLAVVVKFMEISKDWDSFMAKLVTAYPNSQ